MTGNEDCPACNGTGIDLSKEKGDITCKACNGSGKK